MAAGTRLIRKVLFVVAFTFSIIGLICLSFPEALSPITHEREAVPLDRVPTRSVLIGHPDPNQKSPTVSTPPSAELTPVDVMGNPNCIMKPGSRHGRDLAIIVVPGKDGSRFAVVDQSGVVFGGSLPFRAAPEPWLARREDGSVLAGLSGFSDRSTMQGVVVYHDRQIVFENPKATGFGLADDGSSFYVMEPLTGNVTQLAIHNLDLGVEVHHELGALQPNPDTDAYAEYSVDQSEVIVGTPAATPVQTTQFADATFVFSHDHLQFSFYPADGGEPRKLTDYRGFPRFVSSSEAYFALPQGAGFATVKRVYAYQGGEVSVDERWSRELHPGPVSGDGVWLVGDNHVVGRAATEVHVLDASTGGTMFVHRWSTPVRHSTRIHDTRLALGHRVNEHGSFRTVYDVYDVRSLVDGGPPNHYQVKSGEDPHCGSGEDPFGKLEVRDGQLIYARRHSRGVEASVPGDTSHP